MFYLAVFYVRRQIIWTPELYVHGMCALQVSVSKQYWKGSEYADRVT